jgi:hypothetical protein
MLDSPHSGLPRLITRLALIASVAVGLVAVPFLAASQPAQKVFRVGHVAAGGRTADGAPPRPIHETLRGLGYLEGQNIAYEARFAEGRVERLPDMVAELVRLKVDVLVTQGGAATAMYETDLHVRDGGLMSYRPNFEDSFRQAALYIDRTLKGAKPADLPAQQPTTYLLAVNLKTAATLGLTMPPSLLLRANDVVQ